MKLIIIIAIFTDSRYKLLDTIKRMFKNNWRKL